MLLTACASYVSRVFGPALRLCLFASVFLFAGCRTPAPPSRSRVAAPQERISTRPKVLERDDGRWLIAWVIRHGRTPATPSIVEDSFANRRAGGDTPEEALLWAFPDAGLWAYAQYGSWTLLQERLASGCPVIVQEVVRAPSRTRHFAVVTGVNTNTDSVTLIGSDGKAEKKDAIAFRANWGLTRRWMMTVCSPAQAAWPMNSRELVNLIRFYDRVGQREEADRCADEALALAPNNVELLSALAVRARSLGRVNEAERGWRRVLEEDNNHARSANNLAFLLAEQRRSLDEAAALAQRAALLEPGNPRILDTQGFVLMQQGDWGNAVELLDRALRRSRSIPASARAEIGMHLAQAYLKNDEPRFAREVLAALLKENPGLLLPPELAALIEEAPQ